ncbi:uncharacterized protein [Cherax quadricarinatus]|uniref:uncharacterized protein n=1 Tax=Cherax quadricarinatus TaxID=27406 RepID=UPI002378B9FE|nr:uncharacterized protein LOC128686974 [Cherax quadricarinatus]
MWSNIQQTASIYAKYGDLIDWEDFAYPKLDNTGNLEEYYQRCFHKRDFWEDHFNLHIFQQILDAKFNLKPESEYTAQKDHYQLKIRLKVYCKMRQKSIILQMPLKKSSPQLKSLGERRNFFQNDTLEYLIDLSDYPIVGASYLYVDVIHGEHMITCTLCKVNKHCPKEMLLHLQEPSHAIYSGPPVNDIFSLQKYVQASEEEDILQVYHLQE